MFYKDFFKFYPNRKLPLTSFNDKLDKSFNLWSQIHDHKPKTRENCG